MRRGLKMIQYLIMSAFVVVTIISAGPIKQSAYAATSAATVPCDFKDSSILGIPTWYQYLKGEKIGKKCSPVINSSKDALPIGLAIFDIALTLSGLVAVAMIFIGAIRYILSLGEPAKAATAQHTVINALVGLVIIIIAARVVSFIAERLT